MAKKVNFPLSITLGAVDKVTEPVKRMRARMKEMLAPVRLVRSRLSRLSRVAGLPEVTKGLRRVKDAVGGVGSALLGATKRASLLLGAGIAASVALVRSYTSAGDLIAKTADKLGVGIEALQEYRFAAERAGIAQSTVDMALQRFGRRMGEVAMGTGEARTAVKTLGIDVLDAEGRVRSIESLLPEVADRLSEVEDANVRNALAMKFFDSEGVALVNMLQGGSAGLAEMREEARRLGLVMSEDAARRTEEFEDAQTNLRYSLLGVRNVIGESLLPEIKALLDRLTDFVIRSRPRIEAWAKGFAEALPDRLRLLRARLDELRDRLEPVIQFGRKMVDRFGPVNTLLGVLAGLLSFAVLPAVLALIPAVFSLGAALLSTPIGWAIGGLALLTTATVGFGLAWDTVGPGVSNTWKMMRQRFDDWVESLPPGAQRAVKVLGTFAGWLTSLGKSWWKAWTWGWGVVLDGIKAFVSNAVDLFGGLLELVFDRIPRGIRTVGRKLQGLLPEWLKGGPAGALRVEVSGKDRPTLKSERVAAARSGDGFRRSEAAVRVSFEGLPRGARVRPEANDGVPLELDVGYAMGT